MANNYTQATVEPEIHPDLITPEEINELCDNGYNYVTTQYGDYYFFVEEGFWLDDTAHIWQNVIKRSKEFTPDVEVIYEEIEEIVVEGAYTCSKMRPGEFGGFVARITEDDVQQAGTGLLLDMFRQGVL